MIAAGPLPREARVEAIRGLLQSAFAPSALEVIDDSHRHAGHEGAKDGRGHFTVRLVSPAFAGMATTANSVSFAGISRPNPNIFHHFRPKFSSARNSRQINVA